MATTPIIIYRTKLYCIMKMCVPKQKIPLGRNCYTNKQIV